jgi:predicted 3-demethylubiquinone-9 3-methyltransferase (glyoxalase superfamily)
MGNIARYGKSGAEVSGQKIGSVMTVTFSIDDLEIEGLNGGPEFKFTPALSFFVTCDSEKEINEKWKKLSHGGQVRMGLDKYAWAERYAWFTDRFGVEWQLMLSPPESGAKRKPKIVPAFLFVDALFGKGDEALAYYQSIFPHSETEFMARDEKTNTVMHAAFKLDDQVFVLMEGPGKHGYTFSHATSLIVYCDDQKEIDHYHGKLSQGGDVEPCGWVKDKYGVSWQIVPRGLGDLMTDPDQSEKIMAAMIEMKKIDFAALKKAAGI